MKTSELLEATDDHNEHHKWVQTLDKEFTAALRKVGWKLFTRALQRGRYAGHFGGILHGPMDNDMFSIDEHQELLLKFILKRFRELMAQGHDITLHSVRPVQALLTGLSDADALRLLARAAKMVGTKDMNKLEFRFAVSVPDDIKDRVDAAYAKRLRTQS